MRANKLLKVADGLIALVEADHADLPKIEKNDVEIVITDYGVLLCAKDLEIPIPEIVLDHLIETGNIVIYGGSETSYIAEPAQVLEIDKNVFIELRGILNYKKNTPAHKNVEQKVV